MQVTRELLRKFYLINGGVGGMESHRLRAGIRLKRETCSEVEWVNVRWSCRMEEGNRGETSVGWRKREDIVGTCPGREGEKCRSNGGVRRREGEKDSRWPTDEMIIRNVWLEKFCVNSSFFGRRSDFPWTSSALSMAQVIKGTINVLILVPMTIVEAAEMRSCNKFY